MAAVVFKKELGPKKVEYRALNFMNITCLALPHHQRFPPRFAQGASLFHVTLDVPCQFL
jgi:hypothetical protein